MNRTQMKALNTTVVQEATLTEQGREGLFVWRSGNYTALAAADPLEGVIIAANGIALTSGAWVRDGAARESFREVYAEWFGAKGDATTPGQEVMIQAAITFLQTGDALGLVTGGTVKFKGGVYLCSNGFDINNHIKLQGVNNRFAQIWADPATYDPTRSTFIHMINPPDESQFACTIDNLVINTREIYEITNAVWAQSWNEHCGIRDSSIVGLCWTGVKITNFFGGSASGGEFVNFEAMAAPIIPVGGDVAAAQNRGSAGNLTLAGSISFTAGRFITLTSASNNSGVNFTITGTTRQGAPLVETIAGPNNGMVLTTGLFKTVMSIATSAATVGTVSASYHTMATNAKSIFIDSDVIVNAPIINLIRVVTTANGSAQNNIGLHARGKVLINIHGFHAEGMNTGIQLGGYGGDPNKSPTVTGSGVTGGVDSTTVWAFENTFGGQVSVLGCKRGSTSFFVSDFRWGYTIARYDPPNELFIYPPNPGQAVAVGVYSGGTTGTLVTDYAKGLIGAVKLGTGRYSIAFDTFQQPAAAVHVFIVGFPYNTPGQRTIQIANIATSGFEVQSRDPTGAYTDAADFRVMVYHKGG